MTRSIDVLLSRIEDCARPGDFHLEARAQLELLPQLLTPFEIVDEETYRAATKVRCMLSSLDCYTLNFPCEQGELVGKVLSRWSQAVVDFNDGVLIKDETARLLARYLLWTKSFTAGDTRACYLLARKHGVLARLPAGDGRHELVVIGLKRKVGDNVFRTNRRGGEHRCYIEAIGRQGFYPVQRFPFEGPAAVAFLESLPLLDETYHGVSIGDRKYCARPSAFTQPEIQRLYALIVGADVEALLSSPTRSASPRVAPQQLDWLAA